ncbi:Ubiquitin-conjugating enzyme [Penicillium longicatenatum]|nr:Ubiquitin-conjugating enzyme [Penicillium longicatenatum]
MTSPSTKRLLKESTDLHKNPSPYFTAAPISDTNLHDWHFTLAGPPAPAPYAGGLYHGRITFPPTYPLRPPSFRFLTPSGRFEVNREICLSISGHHEETWQPAWGVRTALLAIRSEIFSSESKGQVGGVEGSADLRREYARVSWQWACRECGGSNGDVMKDWWSACVEKGVEVDVEGFEGNGPSGDGAEQQAGTADATLDGERQAEPVPTTASTSLQSEPRSQPQVTAPAEAIQARTAAVASSTVPSQSSTPQTTALQPRPVPASAAITQASEPANSPWLDRAIVVVVFALIILILRQTLDVEDL